MLASSYDDNYRAVVEVEQDLRAASGLDGVRALALDPRRTFGGRPRPRPEGTVRLADLILTAR